MALTDKQLLDYLHRINLTTFTINTARSGSATERAAASQERLMDEVERRGTPDQSRRVLAAAARYSPPTQIVIGDFTQWNAPARPTRDESERLLAAQPAGSPAARSASGPSAAGTGNS